jgi:hypothetical protein
MKIHGDLISSKMDVTDRILETLSGLGLEPLLIPSGRTDALRGGFACLDLKSANYADAVILRSHRPIGSSVPRYIFDYAVRGTIRGINPGSMIIKTSYEIEGFLRKRIVGLTWEVPVKKIENNFKYPYSKIEGQPIRPGEIWEGSPHQILVDILNDDAELMNEVKSLIDVRKSLKPSISVFVDGWGESIRIGIGLWLTEKEALLVYAGPLYISIVEQIAKNIKDVRQKYGGLTF